MRKNREGRAGGTCFPARAMIVGVLFVVACSGKTDGAATPSRGGVAPSGGATAGRGPAAPGGALAGNGAVGPSGAGGASSAANPGAVTASSDPYPMQTALSSVRKVKNLLIGMAPTDDDVAKVTARGQAGLQELISTWTTDPATQTMFRDKMIFFLRNAFQQTGFTPTEDFKMQLLENGGFDFGPFGTSAVGDDAFARLVKNIQDSFAVTAWQLVTEGRPFIETLTTQRFMLTTGLKSLYLQIEMPNDQPYAFARFSSKATPLAWKLDYSGNPIALEDTLNPMSPNYMVFDDQPPSTPGLFGAGGGGGMFQTCHGGMAKDQNGAVITQASFTGYAQLFQRLIGYTPRFPFAAQPSCWEHSSKPIFTTQDLSDWQWVTIRALKDGETRLQPYDLPTLRKTTELALTLPRLGFYTTPAFLALWNTNDSNQHRVTANQTLLVAYGAALTSDSAIVPLSTVGLDAAHTTTQGECYGCHKSLDPLRQFWGNQFDFNDRNDYPTIGFMMTAPNPRPTTRGGAMAFADVNASGASMADLGGMLTQATDGSPEKRTLFASGVVQKLCFYANSTACDAGDPEFRRISKAFQDGSYNFLALIKELFSSPLVTGASATQSFAEDAMPVSISRRDHFCAQLSNRLGKPDLCVLAVPLPSMQQNATAKIAGTVAADAFSRGSETPITAMYPTLFYRAATEMLCENIATQVVDAQSGSVFMSGNVAAAIPDIAARVMGYPPSSPTNAAASKILMDHYNAVMTQNRNGSLALRSAFVLACESPTAVGVGL